MLKHLFLASSLLTLAACSATQLTTEADQVELMNQKPQGCTYLGEAYGSQGNWFTGDFTSNKDLMEGARNDLRNAAAKMGGNVVSIQDISHTRGENSLGTTATTVVGNVYRCP